MELKTFEVQVTATITKWIKVEAEDEEEAIEIAHEDFDCEPSTWEKDNQEVGEVREVSTSHNEGGVR